MSPMPRDSARRSRSRKPSATGRRRSRRRFGSWLAIAVFVGVSLAYVQPIKSYQDARSEIVEKENFVIELKQKRDKLKRKLVLAERDTFIVQEARTHGLVRPGETLFLVQGIEKWQRLERERSERKNRKTD